MIRMQPKERAPIKMENSVKKIPPDSAHNDSQDQHTEFGLESSDEDFNDHNKKYDDDSSNNSMSSTSLHNHLWNRAALVSGAIAIFGILAGSFFLSYGISASNTSQIRRFKLVADELAVEFGLAWEDYVTAAKWLHQACQYHPINRTDFKDISEHIDDDINIQAAEWIPRVYDEDRAAMEASAQEYFTENYPQVNYTGFVGFEPDAESTTGFSIQSRSEQPFYYPIQFVEPVESNADAIGLDLYSEANRRAPIDLALETFLPTVSSPFHTNLIKKSEEERVWDKSILLFHPGLPLTSHPDRKPKDLALIVFKVIEWLRHASRNIPESIAVYIYDTTDPTNPEFVIAAELHKNGADGGAETRVDVLEPLSLEEINSGRYLTQETVLKIASADWKLTSVAIEGTFEPTILSVLVASIFILAASVFFALWIFTDMKRTRSMNQLKHKNDSERAALMLDSAREATKIEQELNDYIAHEVRNPLSAALSALTFVKSAIFERETVSVQEIDEDVQIVDSSLRFINDLLRSMLDFHRAKSKKMKLKLEPFDLEKDLLLPVKAMIYTRDSDVKIETECPPGLVIRTDAIRMKQVVLNLGRNAVKFVQNGYIRLTAKLDEKGCVVVTVEDSGPGIPLEKRQHLFSKFQESLDALNQGTGIGLCLCKNMVDLLGGEISLDESFHSGIDGCPGTRFVINTKLSPLSDAAIEEYVSSKDDTTSTSLKFMIGEGELMVTEERCKDQQLPDELTVLFVDDDLVLRKLFTRSVRKVAKTWDVQDASSGEAALELVEKNNYDVIFVDQYMASVEKQLLGTETTRALRAKGVTSIICGLSANDVEAGFFNAGADFFMFKPFPCRPDELKKELLRILHTRRKHTLEMSMRSANTFSSLEC